MTSHSISKRWSSDTSTSLGIALWDMCTKRVGPCYLELMVRTSNRVNVILDEERAIKLHRLAERTHTSSGTLARSLLSTALDAADPDPRDVTALLDGIDGAWERALAGSAEVRAGQGIPLEDL